MISSLVALWVGLYILDVAFAIAVSYGVLVMVEFDKQKEDEWTSFTPLSQLMV